jgi:thiamine biosynthesis lipoprotein
VLIRFSDSLKSFLKWITLILVLFIIGFFIAQNNSNEIKTFKRTQIILGTIVEIQIQDNDEKKVEKAFAKAFAEIKRIDNLFTTYNENSPVWTINNFNDTIIKVDKEIYNLLVLCDSVTKLSDGAFDVSLDILTRAWGFYSDNPSLPSESEIENALKSSGWNKVKLNNNQTITKQKNVALNFGAIAKGYAVDRAIEILKSNDIHSASVNAGGDVKVFGKQWKIGIQNPREKKEILDIVTLENNSIATSGDYERYFEVDGKRYHHILNPKTGYPSTGLQSVSIINKSNTFADALATAVFVLGVEKGLNLIESLDDTEAMIVDENGKIYFSSNFSKYNLKN